MTILGNLRLFSRQNLDARDKRTNGQTSNTSNTAYNNGRVIWRLKTPHCCQLAFIIFVCYRCFQTVQEIDYYVVQSAACTVVSLLL